MVLQAILLAVVVICGVLAIIFYEQMHILLGAALLSGVVFVIVTLWKLKKPPVAQQFRQDIVNIKLLADRRQFARARLEYQRLSEYYREIPRYEPLLTECLHYLNVLDPAGANREEDHAGSPVPRWDRPARIKTDKTSETGAASSPDMAPEDSLLLPPLPVPPEAPSKAPSVPASKPVSSMTDEERLAKVRQMEREWEVERQQELQRTSQKDARTGLPSMTPATGSPVSTPAEDERLAKLKKMELEWEQERKRDLEEQAEKQRQMQEKQREIQAVEEQRKADETRREEEERLKQVQAEQEHQARDQRWREKIADKAFLDSLFAETASGGQEKRKYTRASVKIDLEANSFFDHTAAKSEAFTINLSAGGALLTTPAALHMDDTVHIAALTLPNGIVIGDVFGKVVHVKEKDGLPLIGIEFTYLDDAEMKQIEDYVNSQG